MKTRVFLCLLALLLAMLSCVACDSSTPPDVDDETTDSKPTDEESTEENKKALLNGVELSKYSIVYDKDSVDYNKRAAEFIRDEIKARTDIELTIVEESTAPKEGKHEIVVGETERDISFYLDADTEGVEFALWASNGHIAMEGDYFVIAAAAYYFVETYITGEYFDSKVPEEVLICEPIQEKAENYIFLIGDGMGMYQTLLFDVMGMPTSQEDYSDGEDLFYGYMLPYYGLARTNSYSNTNRDFTITDSAAAGTALASGYKTIRSILGKNYLKKDVKSLTEIAASIGMATAVMSTDLVTGATPAAFSAHANDRYDTDDIIASQAELVKNSGTILDCNYDYYNIEGLKTIENKITTNLNTLSENEKGFFLMYEEAHIDKHCHSNNMTNTFLSVVRFNQAIGLFMEYAFYHPNTFVLITADHETGNLLPNGKGTYAYNSGDHSAQFVPVFAYGDGGELFEGKVIENTQIPKTIAKFWGCTITGTDNDKYPALN